MSVLKEFKEFAIKGNVVDMAVGVIIGGAFGKIVSSLVGDVIMPAVSTILGGQSFAEKAIEIPSKVEGAEPILIKYGLFLQNIIDFVIISFCVFVMVKIINSLKKKEEEAPAAPPAPSNEEVLLSEIRDLLKK
ncbi:large-conductance mechanosensitive channel protein MscL [Fusobacterium necrophorum]|uniref:large-conductance mechanosensitive channel protein MscL n=1 Tax=Fusobacterium necrophorum TaxID=859 RepID=UPI0008864CAC|nr:large-conductance mechanosensitive channel protein MscL [Fusobacterium necrophorum]AYZ74170.1 large-conductance mechanosensitive channel protein MscL [Fusobacterium necrophorum]AZW09948.1 large-conductance mechanosensitive channel protein MscL [Fusobacterium necrophorum subsp. necrophorum]SDB01813.1 large conductance mechanosensitive channel [Fusobacterium necrophorum]SQD08687.1 Large-conductance mechanosensitive channel [Fusobacterium necrophorum subsp. necrophorum]